MNINDRIQNEIESNDVVLYMKGNKAQQQCGFSNMVSRLLRMIDVKYNLIFIIIL